MQFESSGPRFRVSTKRSTNPTQSYFTKETLFLHRRAPAELQLVNDEAGAERKVILAVRIELRTNEIAFQVQGYPGMAPMTVDPPPKFSKPETITSGDTSFFLLIATASNHGVLRCLPLRNPLW